MKNGWSLALAARRCAAIGQGAVFTPPETKTVAASGAGGRRHRPAPERAGAAELHFKDEQGKTVRLGDYFHDGRPVILNLVYYHCPMLCREVLNGLTAALKVIEIYAGQAF